MTDRARRILDEALLLPIDERAAIAAALLRSVDQAEATEDVERRWATEITRRAERAIAGESTGRDAHLVLDAVEAKLRGQ